MPRTFGRFPAIMAVMAAGTVLGSPPTARADLELVISDSIGHSVTVHSADPTNIHYVNTSLFGGEFNVDIQSTSSTSSTTTELQTNSITVVGGSESGISLTILTGNTGYTQPGTPTNPDLSVISDFTGTFRRVTSGDTVTFQSYADKNNTQNGTGAFTTGLQSYTFGGAPNGSFAAPEASGTFTRNLGAFSVTNVTTITVASNASVNLNGTTTLTGASVIPTPEPGTMAMALIALPLLGLGRWLRGCARA